MSTLFQNPSVGPFMGVSQDETLRFVTPQGERCFRVILYGAYNARGLIGPEFNGIAVLDEDQKAVVVDNIAKQDSGYFGPSPDQRAEFARLCAMKWPALRAFVNAQERLRYSI